MSNPVSRLLERHSLRGAVQRALESDVGVYRTTWRLDGPFDERLAIELLDWCREAVSRMHRPYGVGSVSVAIAVLGLDGKARASCHRPLLQAADFYGSSPFESETRSTLRGWADADLLEQPGTRLSVVLFSWGDLTRELLLAG